jgi:hypothetical protein
MLWIIMAVAIGGIGAALAVYFYTSQIQPQFETPNLTLVDYDAIRATYDPLTTFSGRVVNSGGKASNPVIVEITITDPNGNYLYSTTTSTQPSILQPNSEASFTKQVYDSQLGGYTGEWNYQIYLR